MQLALFLIQSMSEIYAPQSVSIRNWSLLIRDRELKIKVNILLMNLALK